MYITEATKSIFFKLQNILEENCQIRIADVRIPQHYLLEIVFNFNFRQLLQNL